MESWEQLRAQARKIEGDVERALPQLASLAADGDSGAEAQRLLKTVEDHLKAAGEATFLTLLITWSITFVYNRDKLRANPLKNVLGYNNPCVGWDFPPANSVGLFGMILVTVLVWRYNVLDANRTAIKAAGAPLALPGTYAGSVHTPSMNSRMASA